MLSAAVLVFPKFMLAAARSAPHRHPDTILIVCGPCFDGISASSVISRTQNTSTSTAKVKYWSGITSTAKRPYLGSQSEMPPPHTSIGSGLPDSDRDALLAAAHAAGAARRPSTTNEPGVDVELQSPSALRNLVLNYLVHHCYIDTAIAFAQDGIGGGGAAANASVNITKGQGSSTGASARSGGASWSGKKSANGYHLNGKPARNNGNAEHSSARRTGAANGGSTHPLAAPPLSREDSVMEIEAETVAASIDPAGTEMAESGTAVPGYSDASAMYGEAAKTGAAGDEDTAMNDDGKTARLTASAKGKGVETRQLAIGEADLTQDDVLSVLLRRGEPPAPGSVSLIVSVLTCAFFRETQRSAIISSLEESGKLSKAVTHISQGCSARRTIRNRDAGPTIRKRIRLQTA